MIQTLVLLAATLLAPADPARAGTARDDVVRIYVMSDAHSRQEHVARFVAAANAGGADLVIDAGDIVHDGTEPELQRAVEQRAALHAPWYLAPGNHDVKGRGEFDGPPAAFPSFAVAQHGNVRVVLLDNHDGHIGADSFSALEAELAMHADAVHLVAMHVPPFLTRERGVVPLRHLLPFRLASPVMHDANEVERFMALMERHGVRAVIAGHAHAFDDATRGSVRYITAGTLGGLLPGMGVPHEYLVLEVSDDALNVQRVPVAPGAGNPVALLASAFRFLAGVNAFNHQALGWTFTPSTSVQLRTGVGRTREGNAVSAAHASFERQLRGGRVGVLGETGIAAGQHDAMLQATAGARLRVLGNFNRNINASAVLQGGAGMRDGRLGGEATPFLGAGIEWHGLTLELRRGRGGRASILLGHRP